MQINQVLSQLYSILNCKIALYADSRLYFFPPREDSAIDATSEATEGYREWELEIKARTVTFYVEESADISETALNLAALYIRSQLDKDEEIHQSLKRLLSSSYSQSDIAAVNQLIDGNKELYLIIVNGINIDENRFELFEIIKNSLDVRLLTEYQTNLVAAVCGQDIVEACNALHKNIMTELYKECIIAIGGRLSMPQELARSYNHGLEAIELRRSYGLNQKVLDYEGMSVYRIVASMDEGLKQSIMQRIFSSKFIEMLNNEMELTIEELFRNNLNLTDTSARLFIHRNTLLYRIDKVYKLTGFDLRRFEDSMVFKLAWLIYKEKNI